MVRILCARNMPLAEEAFNTLGHTTVMEGRSISATDVRDADILAIRSTTPVGPSLLEGSAVRFVGTATIGIDHLDTAYLEAQGIHWCYSPGCNANSVSEYLVAGLLHLARRGGFTLEGKTLGVVGVGNVGGRVVEKARALGLHVLQNDPPRERAEDRHDFVSLETLAEAADIITMHVPWTTDGDDPTHHMVNAEFLSRVRPGVIFIDAARGPIVDTPALVSAIQSEHVAHCIMDTWEGEPDLHQELLDIVDLGTPHIAGHSYEGKVQGTLMVYKEACRHLGVPATWSPEGLMPEPDVPAVVLAAEGRDDEDVLHELVTQVYDMTADDARLRKIGALTGDARQAHFDTLRTHYPMRREFRFTDVSGTGLSPALGQKIRALGFGVSHP